MSQGVNVNDRTVRVPLVDAGQLQIAIHDPQDTGRDIEHPVAWFAALDPLSQLGGKVRPAGGTVEPLRLFSLL